MKAECDNCENNENCPIVEFENPQTCGMYQGDGDIENDYQDDMREMPDDYHKIMDDKRENYGKTE